MTTTHDARDLVPDGESPDHGLANFRDLAGDGYRGRHGTMRRGLLYRSARLNVDEAGVARLTEAGLVAIHDLRVEDEVRRQPDAQIEGATWHHHPVAGVPITDRLANAEETHACMLEGYRSFVTDPERRRGFVSALNALTDIAGPQVMHCVGGKDRTGWLVALIQHIAGLDQDTITEDYLLTNPVTADHQVRLRERIRIGRGEELAAILDPAIGVRTEYLVAAFAQATTDYGDLDGYLQDGLGLGHTRRELLRDRLTAEP